jgi:hypothetical protein
MYSFTLAAHNIMRWVVIVLAIYALVRIFMGLFGKKEWTETDRKSLSFYAIGMDIQLVLGLLLYFVVSPLMANIRSNMGAAMSDSSLRFFAVEHLLMMLVAVVLAHVAVITAKRATTSPAKFRRGAIWLTLSVLAVLVSIPWAQRPLLPQLGALLQLFA